MSWHYRSPLAFPALFISTLREAAARPDEPIVLASSSRRGDIEALAERFRWFRWCIRQDITIIPGLNYILDNYDVRSSIEQDAVGFILFIIAKPTKVSEFIRLNPDLAREILADCQ
jgi:hypothetical protein